MKLNRTARIGLFILSIGVIAAAITGLYRMVIGTVGPQPAATIASGTNSATPSNIVPVSQVQTSTIYAAREDIPERSIITLDMFAPVALDGPSQGYVTDLQNQSVGYITRVAIPKGNKLRPSYLLGHISDVGIAGAVRPGLRAQIVPIPNKPTLHDLVKVGDYVDVVGSFDKEESRAIVQNVRVLAVDVFGKDFPQVKVAQRGDYKADPRGISEANPGTPNANAPANAPASNATPGQPAPPATPTPTPVPAGPVAKPEAALTLEVTPQQAATIALASSSGDPLDFVLRPRQSTLFASDMAPTDETNAGVVNSGVPEPQARYTSVTRGQLAPYAERKKNRSANNGNSNSRSNNGSRGTDRTALRALRRANNVPSGPDLPSQNQSLPPANPSQMMPVQAPAAPRIVPTSPPPTYDIPVYGDGKLQRTDTVRNPAAR